MKLYFCFDFSLVRESMFYSQIAGANRSPIDSYRWRGPKISPHVDKWMVGAIERAHSNHMALSSFLVYRVDIRSRGIETSFWYGIFSVSSAPSSRPVFASIHFSYRALCSWCHDRCHCFTTLTRTNCCYGQKEISVKRCIVKKSPLIFNGYTKLVTSGRFPPRSFFSSV